MAQKTVLAQYLETAGLNSALDEVCRKVIGNKIILAWILKNTVEEFTNFDVNEIAEKYIEGNPVIAGLTVHQDTGGSTEECIKGEDSVVKTMTEGTVTFGIAMSKELKQEVTQLCNYSKGVEEKGAFLTLCSLVRDGLLKLEEAAKRMNVTEEEFEEKMNKSGY